MILARCFQRGGGPARCFQRGGDGLALCFQRGGGLARSPASPPWSPSTSCTTAAGALPPSASSAATKASATAPSAVLASTLLQRATASTSPPAVSAFMIVDVEGFGLPSPSTHHRTQSTILVMMLVEGVEHSPDLHMQGPSSVRPFTSAACLFGSQSRSQTSISPLACRRRYYSTVLPIERDKYCSMSHVPVVNPLEYIESTPLVWVIPHDKHLMGETQPTAPQLMYREKGKSVSQSLLQEMHALHLKGYCPYKPLSLDDVIVNALGRMELKDGTPMVQTDDPCRLNHDWYWASSVLKRMVDISVKIWRMKNRRLSGLWLDLELELEAPKDGRHLFQLLENPALPKGYNACFHPSLLPLPSRPQAFMEAHDFVLNALPPDKSRLILRDLQDAGQWANVLQGNRILKFWFEDCMNEDGSFPDLTGQEKRFMLQQRVIRCHIYDHRNRTKYDKDEVEFLLHNKNPLLLPWIYHRLMEQGYLADLRPHRLFPFATGRVVDV